MKLLDEVGVQSLSSYAVLAGLVQALMNDPKTFDQGMALLAKTWDAFPTDRMLYPVLCQ